MMYRGKVRFNGNHYESGQIVQGSIFKIENGRPYLFDDEPINGFPFYDEARNQWVEVEWIMCANPECDVVSYDKLEKAFDTACEELSMSHGDHWSKEHLKEWCLEYENC